MRKATPKAKTTQRSGHRLETLSRACALLREFQDENAPLSLTDVMKRTGFERTICFRLLHTLVEEGLLRRIEGTKYASNFHLRTTQRYRIGYASQGHDTFASALSQGLRWSATQQQVDLIEYDNAYSAKLAVRNAQLLIRERVDLAIEFQVHDRISPELARMFSEAGIPVIAVEIPQPGATFFGVDNHRAGLTAGRALVKAAQQRWAEPCAEVLLAGLEIAGALPSMRLAGVLQSLRKNIPANTVITNLDSRGEFVRSFEMTRKHLQHTQRRKTLLAGVNDAAVLGSLRAFEEAGRGEQCIAVGLGGTTEARRELRLPSSSLAATVAFFPERYGDSLISLALDILHGRKVPPSIQVPTELLTPQNVDHHYPRDIWSKAEIEVLG
jgi:ribose transport system substrate-binding protein